MNFIRKLLSFIILVVAIVVLVGICMDDSMKIVYQAFANAFSPFNFSNVMKALVLFFAATKDAIVLIVLGFIGLTMPKIKKQK